MFPCDRIHKQKKMKKVIILTSIALIGLSSCATDYKDSKDQLEERVDSIVSRMSMQEKIEQLYYKTDGNERLGIPQFTGSDGPHGIGNGAKGFSSFPVTIGISATWDTDLAFKVGRAIAMEQAARNRDRIAGPTLDMLIDPRIGRAPETIGEDPYLGGNMTAAFIQGQNSTPVFGTIKHYNLNTYELNRRTNNYLSDKRSLVEFWGYHWKKAIQEGGALSVMCAYNWVNGDKCAENRFLIKELLRDLWGFNYYTMCDWGGFSDTKKALESELDFCEGNDLYINELPEGVKSGAFDSLLVNRAVRNVIRTKLVSGMIDGKASVDPKMIDSEEHRALVYESGLKGLVLLKNQADILPLDPASLKSVALIGPNAADLPLDGHSSSNVIPSYTISVEKALKESLGETRIAYAKGCNINDKNKNGFAEALRIAQNSDYVIFVGGLDQTVEGEGYFINKEADEKGGQFKGIPDRPSGTVLLPGVQNDLIKEIAKVNKNIILVVISGGTCAVSPVINDIKGLLYAFYPGQEGGKAIVDVLLGKYNPSGKLPATIPVDDSQIIPVSPDFRDMACKGAGYRWLDYQGLKPQFPFGYGLSYTTFEYGQLKIDKTKANTGDRIHLSFDITNTGDRAGEEVAQLYLSLTKPEKKIEMPKKQLRGFKKIMLAPGETKQVSFTLSADDLLAYDEQSASYFVPAGEYAVGIGGSSDNLPLKGNFQLEDNEPVMDLELRNVRTVPAYPEIGDEPIFLASLINRGTREISPEDRFVVHFYVDGKEVAYYHSSQVNIPVGGMLAISAENLRSTVWKAPKGQHVVKAQIEWLGPDDAEEDNNSSLNFIEIPGGKLIPEEYRETVTGITAK